MIPEDLVTTIRSLANKRRQGVLRVESDEHVVEIGFFNGRVVSASDRSESLATGICRRLFLAGLLPHEVFEEVTTSNVDILQLQQALVAEGLVSREDFLHAKQAHEFDVLFSLATFSQFKLEFKTQSVEARGELGLAVAANQLLLDLDEAQSENERFFALFGDLDNDALTIDRRGEVPAENDFWFERLWSLLPATLVEIHQQLLLHTNGVKHLLLSLHGRGLIVLQEHGATEGANVESARADDLGARSTTSRRPRRNINLVLLDEHNVRRIVGGITALFLLLFVFVMGWKINRWFSLLGDFSSQHSYASGRVVSERAAN